MKAVRGKGEGNYYWAKYDIRNCSQFQGTRSGGGGMDIGERKGEGDGGYRGERGRRGWWI